MNVLINKLEKLLKYLYCALGVLLLAYTLLVPSSYASDNKRELEYANYVQLHPVQGQIVWLESGDQAFMSLYLPAEKTDNHDAVIIVHDIGAYPDQKTVAYALRTLLPKHHWSSLVLQMPLREASATEEEYYGLFDEAEQRIRAAVDYLHKQGVKKIVLIGYGLGALMATYSVNKSADGFAGLITISLAVPQSTEPQVQTEGFIKNISLPFLDIYAEFDLPLVLETAQLRRLAGKDNPVFWQQKMVGENHTYQQDYELLVKRVYGWLSTTFQKK